MPVRSRSCRSRSARYCRPSLRLARSASSSSEKPGLITPPCSTASGSSTQRLGDQDRRHFRQGCSRRDERSRSGCRRSQRQSAGQPPGRARSATSSLGVARPAPTRLTSRLEVADLRQQCPELLARGSLSTNHCTSSSRCVQARQGRAAASRSHCFRSRPPMAVFVSGRGRTGARRSAAPQPAPCKQLQVALRLSVERHERLGGIGVRAGQLAPATVSESPPGSGRERRPPRPREGSRAQP